MKNYTTGLMAAVIVVSWGCAQSQQPGLTNLPGAAPTKLLVESGWKSSWAPDGKRLVYGKLGGAGLEIVDLESQQHTPVAAPGKDADWSPNGRFIAYVREPSFNEYEGEQVWLLEVETGKTRHLIAGGFPTWSADGKTLYVTTRKDRQILAIKVGSDDEMPTVFFENARSWYPSVSPDGRQIAFGSPEILEIVDRESGQTVVQWPTPGNRGLLPAWSPDGNLVAFGGFDDSTLGVWVLEVKSGRAASVIEGHYTMPAWSKDGARLAFDLRLNQREVWVVGRDWIENRLKEMGRSAVQTERAL